jgi:rRNA maturation endonuclease Nob1
MSNVMLPNEKAFERLAHCHGCERLFRPTWTCRECGCFMRIKARLSGSRCPLGKWEAE